MKIEPLGDNVLIETAETKAGVLDISSKNVAVEHGKVIAIGEDVRGIKKGDGVFFKSWGCDILDYEGKQYIFINQRTGAIKAIFHV